MSENITHTSDEKFQDDVIYPEGTWYTLPEDDEGMRRILQHLAGGDVASEYLMGD